LDISLIQSSSNAIGSIYIIHNYLYNEKYLDFLKQTVSNAVDNKTHERVSNVKAKSTDWHTLLQLDEMKNFHIRVLQTLMTIYKLRSPTPNAPIEFSFLASWGMKHKKGDLTIEHTHSPVPWSGAFYMDVPCDTYMNFADFNETVQLQNNMLILFPGTTKHSVSQHTSDKERISMAFNIAWK
tara:strand:+ start:204 stop:749 length:546 start_codon:yes stop_codon:yes gene_type:complete